MIKKASILFLLAVLVLSTLTFGALKDDIKITLLEKQIQDLSSDGLTLAFYLNIENFSSRPYFLSGYSYRFVVHQKDFVQMPVTALGNSIRIESKRSAVISLPVKITYSYLFGEIPELSSAYDASCYLMGRLHFSDGRRAKGDLPVAFSGDFPIFREPEIEVLSLKMNAMTIAGADAEFNVKIKNRNGFELPVERIEYELRFGGHLIENGRIPRDKNIMEKSERTYTLPLLLNFHEVGRDVYGLLRQPTINVSFIGEIELNSAWGRITLPFDVREGLRIIR